MPPRRPATALAPGGSDRAYEAERARRRRRRGGPPVHTEQLRELRRRPDLQSPIECRRRQPMLGPAFLDPPMPATRGECIDGPRPCPWVRCRMHLMLDVNPETGSIRLNHRALELMPETCALDVADQVYRGDIEGTLELIGPLLRVSREAVRRDEERALKAMRVLGATLRGEDDDA
jgi:hypothetical protein